VVYVPILGRPAKKGTTKLVSNQPSTSSSTFRTMSAIQILKHGLTTNLWKTKGWLFDLLVREGIAEGTKQSRKETCWSYYKSQMLFLEAMQEAKDDTTFDPRRSDHKTGKDGKFIKVKRGTVKPKNALTVTHLCFAFNVPYATFKRWKNDAFISKQQVPMNKGKHVLTDKSWAAQVYSARKMFVSYSM
jgi:hypothetical protein